MRLALLPLLLHVPVAAAQGVAYRAEQFACATYVEHARADLRSETGSGTREEVIRRDGRWRMLGSAAPGGTRIEAWYDSLALVRRTPGGDLVPDTDGVLGGRFRGVLSPDGRWTAAARPFVPRGVGEVTDVAAAFDELLPRLPGFDLRAGGAWTDPTGLRFERQADSLADGAPVFRLHYELEQDGAAPLRLAAPMAGAKQHVRAEGVILWSATRGLLRHERTNEVEAFVPAGDIFPTPVRSRVVERFVLARQEDGRGEACE